MRPNISDREFRSRIEKTQAVMAAEGIDLLFAYGNEAEPQYVRYYSDFWPSFETAAVLIPQKGEPILLIGPEGGAFAGCFSRIEKIRKLLVFRESSEPEYPGAKLDSFESIISELMHGEKPHKIGVAGSCIISHVVYAALEKCARELGAELIKADLMASKLRVIKTGDELACLREAYRITSVAMEKVMAAVRPGVTENQLKGVALASIFEQGGEAEGYPFWILTGLDSNLAIGRVRNKIVQPGDLIQIQVSARYEGYVATMGRPVVVGHATDEQRSLISACLAAQRAILDTAKAGVNAKKVSDAHYDTLKALGYEDYILYGPCHGTGLMEGEYPWIESNSDFILEKDMTFCTCVYLGDDKKRIGIRFEDGFVVTENGVESLSDYRRELIEII